MNKIEAEIQKKVEQAIPIKTQCSSNRIRLMQKRKELFDKLMKEHNDSLIEGYVVVKPEDLIDFYEL